jgi:hypothetical protein
MRFSWSGVSWIGINKSSFLKLNAWRGEAGARC